MSTDIKKFMEVPTPKLFLWENLSMFFTEEPVKSEMSEEFSFFLFFSRSTTHIPKQYL